MNVILISIDTLRFDCVGYQPDKRRLDRYGLADQLETPTLDRFAEKGLCFTNCFSTNTYTTSAHASVFTGLYPPRHGVRTFYDTKLSSSVKTLAEYYKANGYETVMATDKPLLFIPLDLGRGFSHIFTNNDRDLFKFLRGSTDKKIFLFVHFFDVHFPYMYSVTPPYEDYNSDFFREMDLVYKKLSMKRTSNNYRKIFRKIVHTVNYAEEVLFPIYLKGVSKFDKGRFNLFMSALSSAGISDNSLTVIMSDHGEGRSSAGNNEFNHAGDLFDDVLRVPLIIKHPDMKHKTFDNIISSVDIFATILEMSGIKADAGSDSLYMGEQRDTAYFETWRNSRSLRPDNPTDDEGTVFSRNINTEWVLRQRGIRTKDYKYIFQGRPEKWLDDITTDNLNNLFMSYYRYLPPFLKRLLVKHIRNSGKQGPAFDLPNREFVRQLYRQVFSRFEDTEGLNDSEQKLDLGIITRDQLLFTLLTSGEYNDNPRHKVYALTKDPFENSPINISSKIRRSGKFRRHYDHILELEKNAVETESIWDSDGPDKESIMKELEQLGYL